MLTRHFLSDLHLDPSRPELSTAFARYCRGPALAADEIWLLGDIFEYWLGDDVSGPHYDAELAALRELAAQRQVHFIAGNRDFLCGPAFARDLGLALHREPVIIAESDMRLGLIHGDRLCTDDRAYQLYRRVVHFAPLQAVFLRLPHRWRESIADKIRGKSREANRTKAPAIMDVNPQAAEHFLARHQLDMLIHGHTHRPDCHLLRNGLRHVLPDWRVNEPQSWAWLEQRGETIRSVVLDESS